MKVYVNDKLVETSEKYTILQLCSKVGIEIPRFCYHPKLSIAANCRMCLIQVEDSIKPIASCAMGLIEGMKIYTNSSFVKKIRESILEFLLINHPLDCPICDQGGECDLQDQTLIFGSDRGRFYEKKRAVKNFYAGFLVKTFMTRCIHCTRCIRYNSEIEKSSTLGALGRGQNMRISNFISAMLSSPLSGNLIDICPVGALTSKPYAFTSRPWELRSVLSSDVSDDYFSKIRIDVRGNEIMRIIPGSLDSEQSDWISDKSRFMFDGLNYQRLLKVTLSGTKTNWRQSVWLMSFFLLKKYTSKGLNLNFLNLKGSREIEVSKKLFTFMKSNSDNSKIRVRWTNRFVLDEKKKILLWGVSGLSENVIYFNKNITLYGRIPYSIGSYSNDYIFRISFLNQEMISLIRGKQRSYNFFLEKRKLISLLY